MTNTGNKENTMAMWCHLAAFGGFLVPLGSILGPLIFWLSQKQQYPLVDVHGKESLNFQISIFIYMLGGIVLSIIFIGRILMIAAGIFAIVQVILAAISANEGRAYRYPLCIRLVK